MSGQREALIEVLAAHVRMNYSCTCMAWTAELSAKDMRYIGDQHRAHLADAILAALPEVKP